MFSYVDQEVRKSLEADGLLITLDRDSEMVAGDAPSAFMSIMGPVPIPRPFGDQNITLDWFPFVRRTELSSVLKTAQEVANNQDSLRELLAESMSVNSVFALPGFREADTPLVRLHSCCLTGDIFGSQRCDCGPQLHSAFNMMKSEGNGAVVYMSGHEGRGIGLWAKAATYLLQDSGQDTYQANVALGLPEDSRDFSDAAIALKYLLKGKPIRLLSNNPDKISQLEANGQAISETLSLIAGVNEHNERYLKSKKEKGHRFPSDTVERGSVS